MPISHHLHRKLREVLGADAGDDLVNLLEVAQATRGDIAKLRHEMDLRFTAMDLRFTAIEGRFPALKAELQGDLKASVSSLETTLERALKEQTRFMIVAWAVMLASIIGLYTR